MFSKNQVALNILWSLTWMETKDVIHCSLITEPCCWKDVQQPRHHSDPGPAAPVAVFWGCSEVQQAGDTGDHRRQNRESGGEAAAHTHTYTHTHTHTSLPLSPSVPPPALIRKQGPRNPSHRNSPREPSSPVARQSPAVERIMCLAT